MSDTEAWSAKATTDKVLAELDALLSTIRRRMNMWAGDEHKAIHDEIMRLGFETQVVRGYIADVLRPQVSAQIPVPQVRPATPARHRVGEGNTEEWRLGESGPMRRNRGPR